MQPAHIDDPEQIRSHIGAILTRARDETGIPGLAVSISVNGMQLDVSCGVIATDNRRPFTDDARFQIGCITKMLTCLIGAALIDDGKLDAAAPIDEYLPELHQCASVRGVTVSHLMSHTSGYQGLSLSDPGIAYYYTWEKFKGYLARANRLFEPGTVFSYEHSELVLLGEIIRRVTGLDVSELFVERLFDPLQLSPGRLSTDQHQTELAVGDHSYNRVMKKFERIKSIPFGRFWAASLSDLTLPLSEMARLGSALVQTLRPDSHRVDTVMSRTSVERVTDPAVRIPTTHGATGAVRIPTAFCHGVSDYGGVLGHNGSARGQTCGLRFDATAGISVAVGINAWEPHVRDVLLDRMFAIIPGYCRRESPQAQEPGDTAVPGCYVGPYGTHIVVSPTDRGLKASIGSAGQKQRFDIMMEQDAAGVMRPVSNTVHHSIGFFKDPGSGTSCLMFGLLAFKMQ